MVKIWSLTIYTYFWFPLFSSCPRSCLPVIILEALVPEKQVSEAEAGRQRRHLTLLLLHLKSGDV